MASARMHQRTVAGSNLHNGLAGAPALAALRWKPSTDHAAGFLDAASSCFKQAKENQGATLMLLHAEPTSVLDLQTSPGRSCSSTLSSLSSQQSSLSSHDVVDSSFPLVGATQTVAQDQAQEMISRRDHMDSGNSQGAFLQNSQSASSEQAPYAAAAEFLSWMDCMEDAHDGADLELADFEECDVGECPTSQLKLLERPIAACDMDFVNVGVGFHEYGMNQLHRNVEDNNSDFPSINLPTVCDQQQDAIMSLSESSGPLCSPLDENKFFNPMSSLLCRVPATAGRAHAELNDHASDHGSTTVIADDDPFLNSSSLMFTAELCPAASQIMNPDDLQQPVLTAESIRLLGSQFHNNYSVTHVPMITAQSSDVSDGAQVTATQIHGAEVSTHATTRSYMTSTSHVQQQLQGRETRSSCWSGAAGCTDHGQQLIAAVAAAAAAAAQEESTSVGGLQLVHLLLGCAEAIDAACEYERAGDMLCHLRAISSPQGDPMQRIAFHFAEALSDRRSREKNNNNNNNNMMISSHDHQQTYHHHKLSSYCHDHVRLTNSTSRLSAAGCTSPRPEALVLDQSELAYQAFYEVLPFAKFAHFTGNQGILEAVASSSRVHVLDLEIGQGLQWPAFFQSLVLRPGGAPNLRITAVGSSCSALQQTGRRLTHFARTLDLPFEYNPVTVERIDEFHRGLVRLRSDEAFVVNCSHVLHRLLAIHEHEKTMTSGGAATAAAALQKMLLMIRSMRPTVVCLLEVEANHDVDYFMSRFVEALHYFCALFDTLEATLPRDSPKRNEIENITFASQIKDIVAGEGRNRQARHMRSNSWQSHFQNAGFKLLLPSSYAIEQAHLLLALYQQQWTSGCSSTNHAAAAAAAVTPYKLSQLDSGVLTLGWHDTPIIAVSSWTLC